MNDKRDFWTPKRRRKPIRPLGKRKPAVVLPHHREEGLPPQTTREALSWLLLPRTWRRT